MPRIGGSTKKISEDACSIMDYRSLFSIQVAKPQVGHRYLGHTVSKSKVVVVS